MIKVCVRACMHACVRACMHACVRACMHACVHVCMVSVLAEAERVGQKCDGSAANRFSIWKVKKLVVAWLQVYSYL